VAYDHAWALAGLVIVAGVWSCVTQWRGALVLFPVRPGPAALWVVILPLGFYGVVMVGAMAYFLVDEIRRAG
jgi:hypothetical protein